MIATIMTDIDHFMEELRRAQSVRYEAMNYTLTPDVFSLSTRGSKYFKITRGNSVYCFIEKETGDIFKPASWRAPAKGARANVHDYDTWMNKTDPFGGWLYKN